MLVGIENKHFGEMSGIRDTCPEFRDTCPESENSRFRVMKYPTTPDFWWEIKVVYVRNESELLHSVDRHFRRLSIKNRSGYSGHFGTLVRISPDTVKTDDRQKGGVILLEKYKTYVYYHRSERLCSQQVSFPSVNCRIEPNANIFGFCSVWST